MSFALKYAPKILDEVVLGSITLKNKLAEYINGRNLKPLILHGGVGTGKTTIANLLPDAIEGKKAEVTRLKAVEFNSINDVMQMFEDHTMFYQVFTINDQKRNYIISNEINFTPKAAIAFRDVIDDMISHTQFIFTTNYIDQVDVALRDRSSCVMVPPVTAKDWLSRAQWIMQQEGVALPDDQLLKILTTQLQVSSSNRKLLERLEDFVGSVCNPPSNPGGIIETSSTPEPINPLMAA
ncbi:AAA family ATPase [Polynucleobacter yangtzensis]|uniref:AAA family ATPase n=1 Tax=Polynucleobacter yangtzensis TaxID=1743159 RepID=UPI00082964E1|nr:AAA family ATPase [Polynucleobacter yangtzensis]